MDVRTFCLELWSYYAFCILPNCIRNHQTQFENELKMPQSSCLKWTYWCCGIDYSVASLFTRNLNTKGIIPEGLK